MTHVERLIVAIENQDVMIHISCNPTFRRQYPRGGDAQKHKNPLDCLTAPSGSFRNVGMEHGVEMHMVKVGRHAQAMRSARHEGACIDGARARKRESNSTRLFIHCQNFHPHSSLPTHYINGSASCQGALEGGTQRAFGTHNMQ